MSQELNESIARCNILHVYSKEVNSIFFFRVITWIALQGRPWARLPIFFKTRQDTSVTYHIPFAMTTKIKTQAVFQ